MRIIEELLEWKSSGSGKESRINGRRDPLRWPSDTLYPQKLALTSPTSGGCSVGIVRLRTKGHGVLPHVLCSTWGIYFSVRISKYFRARPPHLKLGTSFLTVQSDLEVMQIILSRVRDLCVTYKTGVWIWMSGFIDTLYTVHGTTGNYSAVAIPTLYRSSLHTLGFSVLTSRILATDLSQSHCNFKSHMKSLLTNIQLPTQFKSSAPKLISWQAGVTQLDLTRLNSCL
jgi:hypothetical protein